MKDNLFIDTNIIVYAFDESENKKRAIAKKLFEQATKGEIKAIISNQILAELYSVLTKKMETPLKTKEAQIIINGIIDSIHWKKTSYTEKTITRAIETSIKHKTPFWDAIIAETMLENETYKIITENIKDFEKIPELETINPFK